MSEIVLSERTLELVARRFRALGEPFRLRILQSLSRCEKSVTELVDELEAGQTNVSKHLQLLLDGGLVARRKQGTSNIYSIADPMIHTLCDLVCRSVAERVKEDLAGLEATPKKRRRS